MKTYKGELPKEHGYYWWQLYQGAQWRIVEMPSYLLDRVLQGQTFVGPIPEPEPEERGME